MPGFGGRKNRASEIVDPAFQGRTGGAACRVTGERIHLDGQHADILGHSAEGITGGDMGHDPTQGADCDFKLLERRRILPGDDQVDFLRQHFDRFIEPDQAFGGGQAVQRVPNFRQPALNRGNDA